jgi:hypothetical protein
LKDFQMDTAQMTIITEMPAGAEGEYGRLMPFLPECPGQKEALPLGSPHSQVVLDDQDFHQGSE